MAGARALGYIGKRRFEAALAGLEHRDEMMDDMAGRGEAEGPELRLDPARPANTF